MVLKPRDGSEKLAIGIKRALGITGAAASAALLAAVALPAQAATTPGWRQVFSHHYGVAANFSSYNTVIAPGAKNAWAFGGTDISGGGRPTQSVAVHWNGSSWSGSKLPAGVTDAIIAASAPAANDIWAVTFHDGWILHYDGTSWKVAKHLTGTQNGLGLELTGVVAISAKNVWAFGGSGEGPGFGTWHFDGSTWKQWTGNAVDIFFGSAVSAGNVWAIGGPTAPLSVIEHFNGQSWSPVSSPVLSGLEFRGVTALSASNVWVTANTSSSSFKSYLAHFGNHWSKVLVPWGLQVFNGGVATDGGSGLWFAAANQAGQRYAVHWLPGNKWQRFAISATISFDGVPARIPGSTSMLLSGFTGATTGGSAVIWAYGKA
jgi:hypothetical protein